MCKFIDLTNQKYGKLLALKYVNNGKWLCKCECGNEKIIQGYSLRKGLTKYKWKIEKALNR